MDGHGIGLCAWGLCAGARSSHRTAEDYAFLRRLTGRPIKATLPGPSTLVDGSYDEYYGDERALAPSPTGIPCC